MFVVSIGFFFVVSIGYFVLFFGYSCAGRIPMVLCRIHRVFGVCILRVVCLFLRALFFFGLGFQSDPYISCVFPIPMVFGRAPKAFSVLSRP